MSAGPPDICCVIPIAKPTGTLAGTLEALRGQQLAGVDMQLVLVASGVSAAAVRSTADQLRLPFDTVIVSQDRKGSPAARNAGTSVAEGEIVLYLGDDTPPAVPDLVAGHVAAHRERPGEARAVLGGCVWDPRQEITPVMDWLARTGKMLDYSDLDRDRSEVAKLYSGNISLPSEVLRRVNGYDERFSEYGWGDYDLALRLWDAGVRVAYRPELLVHHRHRYGLEESLGRMRAMGRTADLLNRLHGHRGELRTPVRGGWRPLAARAIAPLVKAGPNPDHLPRAVRDQAYRVLHLQALASGYAQPPLPAGEELRGGLGQ